MDQHPGAEIGILALFSNLFRYVLLERQGGIWSDCDMVCLKPARRHRRNGLFIRHGVR